MSLIDARELQNLISKKLDENVVLEIAKKYTKLTNLKINEIKLGGSSEKGESYLSNIYRFLIQVTGLNENKSPETVTIPVIAKTLLKNVGRRKTFRGTDFFENEIIFYEKVWVELKKFIESKAIEDSVCTIPRCLSSHSDGENDYVALEDMSYDGYKSLSRSSGLNYEYATYVIKLLAKFHAVSLAFKDQQPKKFEIIASSLKETYFSEKFRGWYEKFQSNIIEVTRDAIKKELPPSYLEKFDRAISDDFYGKICKCCSVRNSLSVITHGDVWIPNFLFQYNENGTIRDAAIIDFQLSRYTSLSTDIVFFLYTCTETGLVQNHWDDLIRTYHETLLATTKSLGSDLKHLTLEVIQEDIKKNFIFGLGMSIEALNMSLMDDEDISDLDSIQGDDAVPLDSVWIVRPFKEQIKRQRIAEVIKHAAEKGFL